MRGEIREDFKSEDLAEGGMSVEKQQEMLLMNKLASGGRLPPKTQSSFLQKKLQQRKFFDSGDYAMNQDKEKKHQRIPMGKAVPEKPAVIPELKSPVAETGNVAEPAPPRSPVEVVASTAHPPPHSPDAESDDEEHLQIPRPDTVPQRKSSILHPSVHSKLSPLPHIHHEHNDELSS